MPQIHSDSLNLYNLFYSVRRRLSEVTAGFWTDLEVYQALNRAHQDIAIKSNCLKKEVTVTTISSTQEYDLKDNSFGDIVNIDEDGVSFNINGSNTNRLPLIFKHKWQLNKEFPGWQGIAAGIPQYFYYDKTTKTIGLYPKPNSANAGAYLHINGSYRPRILHAGTASTGSSTTLTLASGSSTAPDPSNVDDYYNGIFIEIYDGTGQGDKAEITDYVGSTKVCTVNFTTTPDNTSVYGMIPQIPEEAHPIMEPYALWKLLSKGGSRTVLANNYRDEYFGELNSFIGDFGVDSGSINKETYR